MGSQIFSPAEQASLEAYLKELHGDKDDTLTVARQAALKRVGEQLAGIAFFNPKCLLDDNGQMKELKDLPDEVAIVIQSLDVTYSESREQDGTFDRVKSVSVRPADKLKAISLLMKYLDMQ